MNDMAVHIDYANGSAGGLSHCDPDAISRQLRRTPSNRGGCLYPIDLVIERAGDSLQGSFAYSAEEEAGVTFERITVRADQMTCRLQRRSLFAYLTDALSATIRGDPIPALA